MSRFFWVPAFAFFVIGCPRPSPEILIEVDPIYITYLKTGDGPRVADMDTDEVLSEAEELFRGGDFSAARKLFRMVGNHATTSEIRRDALHNAGLCSMTLEDFSDALDLFERALAETADDAEHAMTRALQGQCLARLGRWDETPEAFRRALATPSLPSLVRAEALVWNGRGALVREDLHNAELRLKEAQGILLDTVRIRDQQGHSLLAQAYYYQAEIFRIMARRVNIRLPQERMERDLAAKLTLFRQAEDYYSVAIRIRQGIWSCRSGYSLGMMAEEFARDLRTAEVPPDFDKESRELYFQELEPFVQRILGEASDYYDRTIRLAARLKFENEWVEKSKTRRDALAALRKEKK